VQAVAELQARGVNFRSLSDPIDTTIAAGRQALAALVEFECSLKAERAKLAQHAAAQRRGKRRRRPKPSLA
jgi:DNA invertase Pin-like site-specific DNA recombinase